VSGNGENTVDSTSDAGVREAAQEAGSQGLLFDDDLAPMPDDVGFRGPTACSAAGVTYRQLDYWARTGLVEPSVRGATGSGTQRLYSFRDVLLLKIIKRLLDAGVSLQQIRTAIEHLRERGTEDLTRVTLMSDGASVYECRSADEVIDLLQGGQGVFGIAIGGVWREIEGSLATLPTERAVSETAQDELAASAQGASSRLKRRAPCNLGCRCRHARESPRLSTVAPKGQTSPEPLRHPGPCEPGNSEVRRGHLP
jgi:DNA-binding transcriptional MerR regulator